MQAQNSWKPQFSPIQSDLVSLSFIDHLTGWIASSDGDILYTNDAGANWEEIAQLEHISPTRIFFWDSTLGWLSGNSKTAPDSAFVFRTNDGGESWEPVHKAAFFRLNDLFFANDTLGWIVGSETDGSDPLSWIARSIDGGDSWIQSSSSRIMNDLYSVHFRDANIGQVCGQDGAFFGTSSGGSLIDYWSKNSSVPSFGKDLYGIYNGGVANGCAVGESGLVLYTQNNWSSYLDGYSSSQDTLHAVSGLSTGLQFWAAGNNGCIVNVKYAIFMLLVTEEERITSKDLYDICVTDQNHLWAVGEKGTILSYNDNKPPIAVDDEVIVQQDSPLEIDVLDNDTDADNDELRIFDFTEGEHGGVEMYEWSDALHYLPDNGYFGYDTLQYIVTDDAGGYDTASVFIEILEADPGPFEEIPVNFDSVAFGNAIWGDIDRDLDYDVIVCGERADQSKVTSLYINNEGVFEKADVHLKGVSPRNDRSMAFVDLNGDGKLDFIVSGENNAGQAGTYLYMYDSYNIYEEYATDLPGVVEGSVDWGDYDNDGDMDLLLSGETEGPGQICTIFRNDGQESGYDKWMFTATSLFVPMDNSVAAFLDFNGDNFLDVVASGYSQEYGLSAFSYTNTEGMFERRMLAGQRSGSVEFCDYDTDGSLDILLTGNSSMVSPAPVSRILEYKEGVFQESATSLEGLMSSSADWGDYDNDGDYDLLLSGINSQLVNSTAIYENREDTLVRTNISLPKMASGTVAWGDYDHDGDLDILLSGYVPNSPNRFTAIYKNTLEIENQSPLPPENIAFEQEGTSLRISWDEASDTETEGAGLTYNFRLKEQKSSRYIQSPLILEDGTVQVSEYGNSFDHSILFSDMKQGSYYTCQVQTIDAGFHTSGWTEFEFATASEYFQEQDFFVPGYGVESAHWIDYDSDEDLDLFLGGFEPFSFARIYVNDNELGEDYVELNARAFNEEVQFPDVNNDNVLDFSSGSFPGDSSFLIHVNGVGDTILTGVPSYGGYAWGDYENDGDEDLIMTGVQGLDNLITKLYRNDGGAFEDYSTLIPGLIQGDIEWVDFDSDGDLDVALCGKLNTSPQSATRIYENREGAFVNTEMGLLGLSQSDMDFADYDNDGDMDMLICGISDEHVARTIIYENENSRYIPVAYPLVQIVQGVCKWVDLNSDGYYDIILSGKNDNSTLGNTHTTRIYIWQDDTYVDVAHLHGFAYPVIALGDYNNDGRVDLYMAGNSHLNSKGVLYKNVTSTTNTEPFPPEDLELIAFGDSVRIDWLPGEDPLTFSANLSYNLRIGTSPGGSQVSSPKASPNGKRKVVGLGNAGYQTHTTIEGLSPDSVYYLAIQSLDGSFNGSHFSGEQAFSPVSGYLIPGARLFDHVTTRAAWLDFDGDQDLDLMVRSVDDYSTFLDIYPNASGEIDSSFLIRDTIKFTNELLINDFDNDNDPDLLLLSPDAGTPSSMYLNADHSYSEVEAGMDGLQGPVGAWGDFDNDGDEDLILMGARADYSELATFLYKNNGDNYESYDNLLKALWYGEIHWLDIDSDGDKDLLRCGFSTVLSPDQEDFEFIINKNMKGAFLSGESYIPGFMRASMDFGDFDNDGDPDLIYSGACIDTKEPHTYIYSNDQGYFTLYDSITPIYGGSVKWLDVNNDKLLDIVISGYNDLLSHYNSPDVKLISEVFQNSGDGFTKIASLETFSDPVLALGDYDIDGRIDLFLGGKRAGDDLTGIIYNNTYFTQNTPPSIPSATQAEVFEDSVRLSWNPTDGGESVELYYNVRVGTSPGGNEVLSSLAHDDGYRKVVNRGNMQQAHSLTLRNLKSSTTHYFSVQAIDQGFTASRWTDEKEFWTQPNPVDQQSLGEEQVRIYPNPAQEELMIEVELQKQGGIRIELYSSTGQMIQFSQWTASQGNNSTKLEIPGEGIYILRIIYGDKVLSKKVIGL